MVHTYPEEFIPVGDAFIQALFAIEDCAALFRSIDEAETNAERGDLFDKYDAMKRRVERRVRDEIAYGDLPPFVRGQTGQFERLVNREGFRQESFGAPGIENVPHGVDTGGQPVFLRTADFRRWLAQHSRHPKRGAKPKYNWAAAQEEFRRLMKHHGRLSSDDPEWNSQARIEEAIEKYFEKQLGPDAAPSESLIRQKVSQWLTDN